MALQQQQNGIDRSDTLWYKDAVIYQLHVKAFFDANNDGIGDFAGLTAKLDYLQALGVTAIWLLPFYPSPLRDDGYDISDYRGVNPSYGTLPDFRRLVRECHRRGLRVITELVINHTSDQHSWFRRAREAKPGTVWRDFYVWSDTDERYQDTRIIFIDTERSNWTWDPAANAYYWHRFYSHQPDLNYDNPRVVREIIRVLRYWLDMGVDGMRLDAVPYLVEREGTSNENLPETHAILKQIRAEVDARFPDRMLLAEANQWPEDVLDYFGDSDECHMAFHFPLMPRMYMAIAQEDRHPVTDIMRQTPDIPAQCQWAIFLRNHDELTLEMVTERERDYLWRVYASDCRMRINLGIRRRLAPLMDNDRRKIELMNGLLLSMPGTPIIYYGDEIGMGDNVFLGDRDGVRTPMQWTPDRNGGFSRADPSRLYLPPIMDPLYGYEALNVEAQARSPASLLNWTRHMIGVRQSSKAFGRGSIRFLYPGNRKILAYLREYEGEAILCVFNLSRTAQAVELDLARFNGCVPIEFGGGGAFPPIGELYYLLTLPAYGFYWFALADRQALPDWYQPVAEAPPELVTVVTRAGLRDLGRPRPRRVLENDVLPEFLSRQRWFAAKADAIERVTIAHLFELDSQFLLLEADVAFEQRPAQRYCLPLSLSAEDTDSVNPSMLPYTLARLRRGQTLWTLVDAVTDPGFAHALLAAVRDGIALEADGEQLLFRATGRLATTPWSTEDEVQRLGGEQSNSSVRIGEHVLLKLYRKLYPGTHPEIEIGRFLQAVHFEHTPPLLGSIEHVGADGSTTAIAAVHGFVDNQGDGWSRLLENLQQRLEDWTMVVAAESGEAQGEWLEGDLYLDLLAILGQRSAELHRALATTTGQAAFDPEPTGRDDLAAWRAAAIEQAEQAFATLQHTRSHLDPALQKEADVLLSHASDYRQFVDSLTGSEVQAAKTRTHGDYHLGQVLLAANDWIILDFEGEPARPPDQRRRKTSPLRDVACMLRSFDYMMWTAIARLSAANGEPAAGIARLARQWRDAACERFLGAYRATIAGAASYPEDEAQAQRLLTLFSFEKACYELVYEANNRPEWIGIPMHGLTDFFASRSENPE